MIREICLLLVFAVVVKRYVPSTIAIKPRGCSFICFGGILQSGTEKVTCCRAHAMLSYHGKTKKDEGKEILNKKIA